MDSPDSALDKKVLEQQLRIEKLESQIQMLIRKNESNTNEPNLTPFEIFKIDVTNFLEEIRKTVDSLQDQFSQIQQQNTNFLNLSQRIKINGQQSENNRNQIDYLISSIDQLKNDLTMQQTKMDESFTQFSEEMNLLKEKSHLSSILESASVSSKQNVIHHYPLTSTEIETELETNIELKNSVMKGIHPTNNSKFNDNFTHEKIDLANKIDRKVDHEVVERLFNKFRIILKSFYDKLKVLQYEVDQRALLSDIDHLRKFIHSNKSQVHESHSSLLGQHSSDQAMSSFLGTPIAGETHFSTSWHEESSTKTIPNKGIRLTLPRLKKQ